MKRILRFTASWCKPCQNLSQQLSELELKTPIEVVDVDVFPEVAADYGVRSIPTLIVLDENIEIKRHNGASKTKEQLKEWIES